MSDEYYDDELEAEPRPRDRKIDEVKEVLLARYFPAGSTDVYYGRQLEVKLEREFFHWITKRGLNELRDERKVGFVEEPTLNQIAHFYWPLRHRYPRRQIAASISVINEFSRPAFARAVGSYQELLADAAFARLGFRVCARNVSVVDERKWEATGHDLDRLVERDGVRYGVEIKNELGYIGRAELEVKVRMCAHLGIIPMFVARVLPKNYIDHVADAGGFSLILGSQNYPPLAEDLAQRVRDTLGLPVYCVTQWSDSALQRFERWHDQRRGAL